MAKQRSNGGNKGENGFGNTGEFADVKLNAEEKKAYMEWAKHSSVDWLERLTHLIGDSYRVSIKYDYNNNCLNCTLTQQDAKHRNAGLIITSRSDNVEDAILLSFFKVFVLYESQRLPTNQNDYTWG